MGETFYKPKLICPRCGKEAKETFVQHGKTRHAEIKCPKCKLELNGPDKAAVETLWLMSKEKRLDYAVRAIRQFGNTYVGRLTLEVWKNDDICAYLEKKIGRHIQMREPQEVKDGTVLYAV